MAKPKQKKLKLTPVDRNQCQAMELTGCWPDAQHFMNLGPGQMERCKAAPVYVAHETKPNPKDGLTGAMSLCQKHLDAFTKLNKVTLTNPGEFRFTKI